MIDIILGAEFTGGLVEVELKDKIDTEALQQFQLLLDGGQARGAVPIFPGEILFRVGFEQYDYRGQVELFGFLLELVQDKLMPKVYPIEFTDGSDTVLVKLGESFGIIKDNHGWPGWS
jgi:hypothetical protein